MEEDFFSKGFWGGVVCGLIPVVNLLMFGGSIVLGVFLILLDLVNGTKGKLPFFMGFYIGWICGVFCLNIVGAAIIKIFGIAV